MLILMVSGAASNWDGAARARPWSYLARIGMLQPMADDATDQGHRCCHWSARMLPSVYASATSRKRQCCQLWAVVMPIGIMMLPKGLPVKSHRTYLSNERACLCCCFFMVEVFLVCFS
jgi:hypothetical protein